MSFAMICSWTAPALFLVGLLVLALVQIRIDPSVSVPVLAVLMAMALLSPILAYFVGLMSNKYHVKTIQRMLSDEEHFIGFIQNRISAYNKALSGELSVFEFYSVKSPSEVFDERVANATQKGRREESLAKVRKMERDILILRSAELRNPEVKEELEKIQSLIDSLESFDARHRADFLALEARMADELTLLVKKQHDRACQTLEDKTSKVLRIKKFASESYGLRFD